ncbi:MAG: phosphoglycerate kinase [bacterium]|nr:phosphoglycerate kinase [bacterium]
MKTIRDLDLKGKRVLVRSDFNIPLDEGGNVLDDFRIARALPTIRSLLKQKAKVIVMSHLGNPGGKVVEDLRLDFVRQSLSKYLGQQVAKAEDCVGADVKKLAMNLKEGEILLLENLRFHKEEELNDLSFAKELASLAEVFINDAFSTSHRMHASIVGVPKLLPSLIGLLMEKEIQHLEKFSNDPSRPFVAIVGGMKVKDKLAFIDSISKAADVVLIGNLIANEAKTEGVVFQSPGKIVFPLDGGYDIGPKTTELFLEKLKDARSVFWTGPLGWTSKEEYAKGSLAVAEAIIKSKAFAVAGGGNLGAFLEAKGLREKFSFVSTGGGASLAFLAGEKLPGLEVLGYYG